MCPPSSEDLSSALLVNRWWFWLAAFDFSVAETTACLLARSMPDKARQTVFDGMLDVLFFAVRRGCGCCWMAGGVVEYDTRG